MSSTQKGTILIIEDEVGFRRVFQDALTDEGYNVLVAEDGESGWQLAKSQKPDLILLDLVLPKLHGLEVLRNVRADATTKDTPVIVVTVLGEREDIRKGLELGANDYMTKGSYSPSEILRKIRLELHLKRSLTGTLASGAGRTPKGSEAMKVLVIESSEEVIKDISFSLRLRWPEARVASVDGLHRIEVVEAELPDLVMMDLSLPGALDLLGEIREFSDVPLIVLAEKENEMDRVKALEMGADDYITKPFSTIDLLARVKALLRRTNGVGFKRASSPFVSGELVINFATREVFISGERRRLTPIEYNLLSYLVRNEGRVVSHHTLLEKAWGSEYINDVNFIKQYIYRLRQKLGDDADNPRMLLTERGVGYRFMRPT